MGKAVPAKMAERIELWPCEKLKPYSKNARTHSSKQVNQIAASITEFGFTNPILVDGENGIIAGHGRLMAAKRLKLKEVPVIVLSHLSDAQRRAYILADNKLALNAGWDEELLAAELKFLKEFDFDLELIGFDDDELSELLPEINENEDGKNADASIYSDKIQAPVYEPKGEKPELAELYDTKKTQTLLDQIDSADLPEQIKTFLRLSAARHTVFNYEKIADFYAHSALEVQDLMEKSALVIIDFDKAIENGFVALTKEIAEAYPNGIADEE